MDNQFKTFSFYDFMFGEEDLFLNTPQECLTFNEPISNNFDKLVHKKEETFSTSEFSDEHKHFYDFLDDLDILTPEEDKKFLDLLKSDDSPKFEIIKNQCNDKNTNYEGKPYNENIKHQEHNVEIISSQKVAKIDNQPLYVQYSHCAEYTKRGNNNVQIIISKDEQLKRGVIYSDISDCSSDEDIDNLQYSRSEKKSSFEKFICNDILHSYFKNEEKSFKIDEKLDLYFKDCISNDDLPHLDFKNEAKLPQNDGKHNFNIQNFICNDIPLLDFKSEEKQHENDGKYNFNFQNFICNDGIPNVDIKNEKPLENDGKNGLNFQNFNYNNDNLHLDFKNKEMPSKNDSSDNDEALQYFMETVKFNNITITLYSYTSQCQRNYLRSLLERNELTFITSEHENSSAVEISNGKIEFSAKIIYNILLYYLCKICYVGYSELKDFEKHFQENHQHLLEPCMCNICGRVFIMEFSMKEHCEDIHAL